ncbi:bifunctional DNA primase/polymerase [Streptomyces cinnamoneus]|uniref:bifunctional DNA primase/polymerase n=1 Tax=Streptomyces cinnamoneus TaxID=53446 RepID=UPI003408141D
MPQELRSALLRAALDAAERGWPVFPLRPGDKRPALHGETRCPRTGPCGAGHVKWEERATTDPERIRRAWSAGPFNIGLATGPAGLLVVDLDKPKSNADAPDGAATFQALCERAGQAVPTTRTIRTASGGTHLYFTAPTAARLHNTAGTLAPLVDTRAWGGYVVAAGSHVNGAPYETVGPALLNPLPGWLLALLIPPHPRTRPAATAAAPLRRSSADAYAAAALRNEENNVAAAPEGQRNKAVVRAARALGRLVASGDLDRNEVETALSRGAEVAGQKPHEYRSAITSALNWSIHHNSGTRKTA